MEVLSDVKTHYTQEELAQARNTQLSNNSLSNLSQAKYISEAQTQAKKLDENKSHFLKMLVTQLKNQDPTNPMDTDKMTQQLSMFSLVEQVNQINQHMEELSVYDKQNTFMNSASYIGKGVEVVGDTNKLKDGKVLFAYTLPSNASESSISIRDANGREVFNTKGNTSVGHHILSWDGVLGDGSSLPEGSSLTMSVVAKDSLGYKIPVEITAIGEVESVSFMHNEPMVSLGTGQDIPANKIISMHALLDAQERAKDSSIVDSLVNGGKGDPYSVIKAKGGSGDEDPLRRALSSLLKSQNRRDFKDGLRKVGDSIKTRASSKL